MAGLNDFVVFNDFAQASFTEEIDQLLKEKTAGQVNYQLYQYHKK